ncbi:hypothetical protein [uncultured Maricaulis sp.]|uniref:hypothetical protein n=1 Tax=uncultured Maricaulis sp. TaxID=174710 RepID=UPI0030D97176|tara:strand:+ start:37405 stop:37644 length:240 start_codon:yes stop_codon:yes gene_type:complete
MIVKPILIGVALAALASLPLAVPMAAGVPVALAVGPVAITYDRDNALDLDFDIGCFSTECPVVELRYGASGQETLKIGL